MRETDLDAVVGLVESSRRLFVLTGAGCSTESGIPDYRDAAHPSTIAAQARST